MNATNNITINEKGDLVITFEARKIQTITASKQENMLLVPASKFKSLTLNTISDVVCDTERKSNPGTRGTWILMIIDTNGKSYVLGKKLRPVDADEGRKALISYLFPGASKPIVYLSEKVKILKFSRNEAYFELNLLHNQKMVFYLWLFYFLGMILAFLALGIIFSGVGGTYIMVMVLSIVGIPAILCAGNLYYRGLFVRNRVLMSFVDKTITIEKYSVRHERIMSTKTYSVNTIKTLSLQILTSRGSSVFSIQIVLENRKREKLITMNYFLSAQRLYNLINNFATMINKGQSFNIAESVDNFLVYGRVDFHDLDNYNSYIMNKHKKLNLRLSFT